MVINIYVLHRPKTKLQNGRPASIQQNPIKKFYEADLGSVYKPAPLQG